MKKPNIVFIISDDQGYWSLGCAGNKEIITPNIDRLSSEGIRLKTFSALRPCAARPAPAC